MKIDRKKEENYVFIFVRGTKQMMLMWFELIVYVGSFSSIVLNGHLSRWCRNKTQSNKQLTVSDFNQLKFNAISFVCLNLKMKMKMQFYDNKLCSFLCLTISYTFLKFTAPYEFCHSSIVLVCYEFMQVLAGFSSYLRIHKNNPRMSYLKFHYVASSTKLFYIIFQS